jgi:transposase-like protein
MTKPFSFEFKRKMIRRLTGSKAVTPTALAAKTGVSQGTLSNWLREARTLPEMIPPQPKGKQWRLARRFGSSLRRTS